MKDETIVWLSYAEENLLAARLLLEQGLYNPCLQNIQQSVEKGLKALLLEKTHSYRKTHSITELVNLLTADDIDVNLTVEDCDLLDSIYLPSKYPLGSVLPNFEPDDDLCCHCLSLAQNAVERIKRELG